MPVIEIGLASYEDLEQIPNLVWNLGQGWTAGAMAAYSQNAELRGRGIALMNEADRLLADIARDQGWQAAGFETGNPFAAAISAAKGAARSLRNHAAQILSSTARLAKEKGIHQAILVVGGLWVVKDVALAWVDPDHEARLASVDAMREATVQALEDNPELAMDALKNMSGSLQKISSSGIPWFAWVGIAAGAGFLIWQFMRRKDG